MTSSRLRRSLAGTRLRSHLLQREWSASDFQTDTRGETRTCGTLARLLLFVEVSCLAGYRCCHLRYATPLLPCPKLTAAVVRNYGNYCCLQVCRRSEWGR